MSTGTGEAARCLSVDVWEGSTVGFPALSTQSPRYRLARIMPRFLAHIRYTKKFMDMVRNDKIAGMPGAFQLPGSWLGSC